jgi:hypothetical protein
LVSVKSGEMPSCNDSRHPESDRLLKTVLDALARIDFWAIVVQPSDNLADSEARLAQMRLLELATKPAERLLM